KLRPRERRATKVTSAAAPDIPAVQQRPGEIPMAASPGAPARPKLELTAGAAPRVGPRPQSADAEPAPDVGTAQASATTGNAATFIALSATPGPPAPVDPPQGNLAAHVSISPEGKQPGVPGGSPNGTPGATGGAGGGPGSPGGTGTGDGRGKHGLEVSISGGNPPANSGVSGLGGAQRIGALPRTLVTRPDPPAKMDDTPDRAGPPNFAALPAGAQPERIFVSRKVYRMLVNMPNLNSATGS